MTDWIRLFVLAGLVLVSCGGQVGDTAEAGGVGAGVSWRQPGPATNARCGS